MDERTKKLIKTRVIVVLKHWIAHEDSEKEQILDEISKFVDSIDEEFSDMANVLEKSIHSEVIDPSSSSSPFFFFSDIPP